MTRTTLTIGFTACLLGASKLPAQASSLNWNAVARESQSVLSDYLRVNTTNPPGNEILGARFLKAILDREGIEAQILDTTEMGPNRANLYARLRGNGSKKAIALVHHLDVVPATPASWSVDPFSGAVKDGYIWGRGAIDMKGHGVAQLMAMIALKRSGVPLTRDIVFIGNADEELGSTGA
ncbi:MAG TPA: M20/M25/M40 family metallo-hydrolase, partial [Gemmatimonadaceae bacterium]|nr:M20/M25/M40 family metallo-hydrolase [Gemmatimonadaceae bacterium]